MKFLLAFLALAGAGLMLGPPVARTVRARVQQAKDSAQRSVTTAERELDQWGNRLVETVAETGSELIDQLPTAAPAPYPPSASPPNAGPFYPAPVFAPWPYPVTIFRHETFRRRWARIGRP
jgi:hypothetical protein